MNQPTAPRIPGFSYLRDLGAGGYADVYLYQQEQPYRQVAVKVLRDTGVSTKGRQMFAAEANAMAQLEHPYIVRVYSTATTSDGLPYIVMSYYPGGSLAGRVRREPMPVAEVLQVGIQIGAAVETAHRARILHRDIKPANILVNALGAPGLTDFGIAAQIAAQDDEDAGLSVPWSPPELLYSTGPAGVQTDVYSLAATLWHLLVGRSPFEVPGGNNSVYELMKRVRDLPAPSTGRRDVPSSLDRLLKQGMSKQASLRPQTPYELIRSLQAIEQELQLPRTQIMVAADTGPTGPVEPVVAGDRTVVQPKLVDPAQGRPLVSGWGAKPTFPSADDPGAQAADQVGYRPVPDEAGTIRQRQVIEATQLKAPVSTVVHYDGSDVAVRRSPWKAIVAVAAVLVLTAGIGATLLLGGGGPKAATKATASVAPPTAQVGGDRLPPGPAVIKATRDGRVVTFSWTYSAQENDDSFRYRLADGTIGNTKDPGLTLTVPVGTEACLQVMVYRNDGSNPQKDWSPRVCAP